MGMAKDNVWWTKGGIWNELQISGAGKGILAEEVSIHIRKQEEEEGKLVGQRWMNGLRLGDIAS